MVTRMTALVVTIALLVSLAGTPAVANPTTNFQVADTFAASGVSVHDLANGDRLVVTVNGPAKRSSSRGTGLARPLSAYDKWVTVGIDRYNGYGDRLWTFSLTVHWGYDFSQVTFTEPSSQNSIWMAGWYQESKPTPTWYWISQPRVTESHGEATNKCCYSFPTQTDNPHVWIGTNADGDWNARTYCC